MAVADAAIAGPIIFNQPFTARPGDFVSLTGSGFGPTPHVFLKASTQTAAIEIKGVNGKDTNVVFELPKTLPFAQYEMWVSDDGLTTSAHVVVNAPRAMHFDFSQVASAAPLRIFGRNLYLGASAPTVSFVDQQTNASLAANVNLGASDSFSLSITTPAGLLPDKIYNVLVSNGYGSVVADQTITARAGGADPFALGTPWAADFAPLSANKFDVKTSPSLTLHAKGDGVANDAPAIQAAIDLATKKGGIVYLPAGTYNIGGTQNGIGLILRPNVVLQGHSSTDTKVTFGPKVAMGSSYWFYCIYTNPATKLAGIADLSFKNNDLASQKVINLSMGSPDNSEVFIQRVTWDLGSGKSIDVGGDRIAFENSNIQQAANSQLPYANGASGQGPLLLQRNKNLIFRNNKVKWASGNISLNDLSNGVVENNHFTRSASDQIVAGPAQLNWPNVMGQKIKLGDVIQRTPGRQISVDFGTNSVFQNNVFDTSNGVIKYNWDDGETILSEAGSGSPREDSGSVTAAGSLSITDDSRGSAAWNYDSAKPYVLVVVSGSGAGQWRNIVAKSNNTFTLDKPLDVAPAAGDHFIIAQPSFLNVIIRKNTMSGNPIGIGLYDGTFLNVSVASNNLTDNGGIYLNPVQQENGPWKTFSAYRNIEVNNNIIQNKSAYFPAYIDVGFRLVDQKTFYGRSLDTVEVRNNRLTARPGTVLFPFEEGYKNWAAYQNGLNTYVEQNQTPLVGTIFQGNSCANCAVNYKLTGGDLNTVIWNATSPDTNGFTSKFMTDRVIDNSTKQVSVGTVIGKD